MAAIHPRYFFTTPASRGQRLDHVLEATFPASDPTALSPIQLPSAFEFGSHVGIGLRVARNHTFEIGIQHLSNAGIQQPNGGIDLALVH